MLMKRYYLWIYVLSKTSLTCPLRCLYIFHWDSIHCCIFWDNVLMFFTSSNFTRWIPSSLPSRMCSSFSRTVLIRAIDAPFQLSGSSFYFMTLSTNPSRGPLPKPMCATIYFFVSTLFSVHFYQTNNWDLHHQTMAVSLLMANQTIPNSTNIVILNIITTGVDVIVSDYATIIWKPLQDLLTSPENLMIWRVTQKSPVLHQDDARTFHQFHQFKTFISQNFCSWNLNYC